MNIKKAEHLATVKTELADKYTRKARVSNSDTKRRQFEHRARAHRRKAQALRDAVAFHQREAAEAA